MEELKRYYNQCEAHFDDERRRMDEIIQKIKPSITEFSVFEWASKQQLYRAKDLEDSVQYASNEHDKYQTELNQLKHELETMANNSSIRQEQIHKLSQLLSPIEHDQTFVIKDHSLKIKGNTTSMKKFDTNNVLNEKFQPLSIQIKSVKDGEIMKLEKRLEDVNNEIIDYYNQFMIDLVEADDMSRSVIQHINEESKINDLKAEAHRCIETLEQLESKTYLTAYEYLKLRYHINKLHRKQLEDEYNYEKLCQYYKDLESNHKKQLQTDMNNLHQNMQLEINKLKDTFNSNKEKLKMKFNKIYKKEKKLQRLLTEREQYRYYETLREEKRRKYQQLYDRNQLELEGYQNEIALLRKEYQSLQTISKLRFTYERIQTNQSKRHENQLKSNTSNSHNQKQLLLSNIKNSLRKLKSNDL